MARNLTQMPVVVRENGRLPLGSPPPATLSVSRHARKARIVLTAKDLTVEVGGTTIVRGASLDIRPGDKVGLVGRNGAGKTTLLRVLGGATTPRSGKVQRAKATGYLSQDPRSDAVPDDTNCLAHVLSGRGLDTLADRLEKARIAMEEDAVAGEHEQVLRRAGEVRVGRWLRGRVGGAQARRRASGSPTIASTSPSARCRAVSAGGSSWCASCSAGSELLLLDEPTNHLDADARDWLLKLLRTYRGALLVVSHDLDLLDDAITRVVHVDRESEGAAGNLVEYKGTYSQYLDRAATATRSAWCSRRSARRRRSRACRPSPTRCAGRRPSAHVSPRTSTTASRRSKRSSVTAPTKRRKMNLKFPKPPHCGRTVLTAASSGRATARSTCSPT